MMKKNTVAIAALRCEKCQHTWKPRTEKPVKCPSCGNRNPFMTAKKRKRRVLV